MSKNHPPQPDRKQPPEPEWLCLCVRKVPGTYEAPGGWELRVGSIPEGRTPTDQVHAPNLLAVILGKIEGAIVHYREYGVHDG